jgi:putative DNA primase/helicase
VARNRRDLRSPAHTRGYADLETELECSAETQGVPEKSQNGTGIARLLDVREPVRPCSRRCVPLQRRLQAESLSASQAGFAIARKRWCCMSASAYAFARGYRQLGLTTIRLAQGLKNPNYFGWKTTVTAPDHWIEHPDDGIAVRLAPSNVVAADIDDLVNSPGVFQKVFGLDLDELKAKTPCVRGRNYQLLFRAPAGVELKHRTATWPKPEGRGNIGLFEFRSGNITTTVPPTFHPGAGRPYAWETSPRNGFPELPRAILDAWVNWPDTQRRVLEHCPWWTPPKPAPMRTIQKRNTDSPSVIQTFNECHDAAAILESHGYRRDGKRFAAPDCKHAAGITLLPSGKIFCHNQGDVLASEYAHDAFDTFRILDHGGDFRAAVRAAAQALGMNQVAA